MDLRLLFPAKLALFGVLSALDLALTYNLLKNGNGRIYEGNPIANAWLTSYGWGGLTTYKVLSVVGFVGATVCVTARRPRVGQHVLTVACSILGVVVLYSWTLLWLGTHSVHQFESRLQRPSKEQVEAVAARARSTYVKWPRASKRNIAARPDWPTLGWMPD
jgi:hypothetical protein